MRQKLAADGVSLSSVDAVEKGICINEVERDLTYNITKKSYPYPNEFLMHNPFIEEKPEKKKKKRKHKWLINKSMLKTCFLKAFVGLTSVVSC